MEWPTDVALAVYHPWGPLLTVAVVMHSTAMRLPYLALTWVPRYLK